MQYVVGEQKQDIKERKEGVSDYSQTSNDNLFLVQM